MSAIRKAGEEKFRSLYEKIKALKIKEDAVLDNLANVHCLIEKYRGERRELSTELFRTHGACEKLPCDEEKQ